MVHAPNGHDSRGAQPLLPTRQQLRPAWASRLRSVLTDKAYQGRFAQQVQVLGGQHQVASRPPTATRGFVPVAQRWVAERTFAWLNCFRRVVMDYERQPASVAASRQFNHGPATSYYPLVPKHVLRRGGDFATVQATLQAQLQTQFAATNTRLSGADNPHAHRTSAGRYRLTTPRLPAEQPRLPVHLLPWWVLHRLAWLLNHFKSTPKMPGQPTFVLLSGGLLLAKALKRESGANPEQFPLL